MTTGNERKKYVAFALIVVFIVSGMAVFSFYYPGGSESPGLTTSSNTSTRTSSGSYSSDYWSNQPYLNASKVYVSLGYPKIAYDYYTTPYLPSQANFTLEYRTKDVGFHVGTIQAPVINLNAAVKLASDYAKLDPSNYTLGQAVFTPASVLNSTLMGYPEWFLYFAEIHDGYWIYGNHGPQALSLEVALDAMNGTIRHIEGNTLSLPNSGEYDLRVNSSQAVEAVRASNLPRISAAMTKNGTVSFVEPRVVIPHLSPNTSWLDSSLGGQGQLLWIVNLDYSNLHGIFAVDAGTGVLVAGSAGISIENGLGGQYYGAVAFSTASGLAVSQQTFDINGSTIGRPGSVGVVVPHVLIAKPGSTASIQLNYTTFNIGAPPKVTLSFANPLPGFQNSSSDGSPPGVSFQFSSSSLTLLNNGSAYATLLTTVDKNAPKGTYLVEVDATFSRSDLSSAGRIQILFFLSVWTGAGDWPPPPIIK